MSLHDGYARVTPFEIAFPDAGRLQALTEAVLEEAPRRGVEPNELDGFLALGAVGDFLAEVHGEMHGEEAHGAGGSGRQGEDVPRVALLEYGTLAFHAVQFLRAGSPLYLLTTEAARALVETAPAGAAVPPARAGYLQLPQHLVWARPEGAPPESLDGVFWTVSGAERLHVLPISGVRPDRPGFGTLAVPDAPLAHAAEWLHAAVRGPGEEDYASNLPGAHLDRLYEIRSVGEILKLMARFFAHVSERPAPRGEVPAEVPPGGPKPSALPFARVGLG